VTDGPNNQDAYDDIARGIRELPTVEADPSFRARLRSEFASGQIDAAPTAGPARAERKRAGAWWRWVLAPAAAAAVIILVVMLNRGPALRVVATQGSGTVDVGGQSTPLDAEQMTRRLAAGAQIETPEGVSVDLLADGVALYEVAALTRMTIPETPGRWFSRAVSCSLYVGEIRLKTGSGFSGSELVVYTPEGMVEVTGTLLSIQRDDSGTCVCVLEGVARVGVNENDLEPVTPGFRKVMMSDGTEDIIPVKPMHRDGVLDFDRRMGNRLEKTK
jgi:ferric-dicitrate binding protein FerR (iron transport regulator)